MRKAETSGGEKPPCDLAGLSVLVTRPALSDPELIDFPGIGTLEAFNTDGLRTLAKTVGAPNMKEKTLRYPGHIDKMRLLRDCGFFGEDPVQVAGGAVRPVDEGDQGQHRADLRGLLFPLEGIIQGIDAQV